MPKINTKICHSFNQATGEYLGQSVSYVDPMTPNQFNLPAGAVWTDPAQALGAAWTEQNWPFWDGQKWVLVDTDVPA